MIADTNGHGPTVVEGARSTPRFVHEPGIDVHVIGDLFQDLAQKTGKLISLEMELAKTELSQTASKAGKGVAFIAAGGVVAFAGFLALMASAIIGLAYVMPFWLSALIIGVVVALIGYGLFAIGMNNLKAGNLMPKQTIDSLKKDKEWLQEKV
jgi:xanthine/uracil permease